jgi:hypothetical protein
MTTQVFIRMLRPKTYIFNVNLKSPIIEIKKELKSFLIDNNDEDSKIPLNRFGLMYAIHRMEDHLTLEDYNITKDDTLHVYIKNVKVVERMPSFILL